MARNLSLYEANQTAYDLNLLAEDFRLYPLPDVNPPHQPQDWGKFLLEHPQYTNSGAYYGLALKLTERIAFEGLDKSFQQLGSSLLAVTFSEEDLKQIASV
jgi:hypothetical protein